MNGRTFRSQFYAHLIMCAALISTLLLLGGCASTQKKETTSEAAAPTRESASTPGPSLGKLQSELADKTSELADKTSELADRTSELAAVQAELTRIQKLNAQLTEEGSALQKKYDSLLRVLNQIAYARKSTPRELMAGQNADSAVFSSSQSFTDDTMVVSTTDFAGRESLVDARANASTGSGIYLSIADPTAKPPILELTVQYRYPDSEQPFMTRSIELKRGSSLLKQKVDGLQSDWYRSNRFKVEAFTTTDAKTIRAALGLILNNADTAFPEIVMDGITGSVTRLVTRDQMDALSNIVYAYRQLGGTELVK
jgi:X-X-X-Leu-X-X-Gly heptad repeat protein